MTDYFDPVSLPGEMTGIAENPRNRRKCSKPRKMAYFQPLVNFHEGRLINCIKKQFPPVEKECLLSHT